MQAEPRPWAKPNPNLEERHEAETQGDDEKSPSRLPEGAGGQPHWTPERERHLEEGPTPNDSALKSSAREALSP
jgi:hypothetical protein